MYARFLAEDGDEFGSFEVFYFNGKPPLGLKMEPGDYWADEDGNPLPAGYYWQACFPGCMPDSEFPSGPFETEAAAFANAREEN